jgi:hypothetical protein
MIFRCFLADILCTSEVAMMGNLNFYRPYTHVLVNRKTTSTVWFCIISITRKVCNPHAGLPRFLVYLKYLQKSLSIKN